MFFSILNYGRKCAACQIRCGGKRDCSIWSRGVEGGAGRFRAIKCDDRDVALRRVGPFMSPPVDLPKNLSKLENDTSRGNVADAVPTCSSHITLPFLFLCTFRFFTAARPLILFLGIDLCVSPLTFPPYLLSSRRAVLFRMVWVRLHSSFPTALGRTTLFLPAPLQLTRFQKFTKQNAFLIFREFSRVTEKTSRACFRAVTKVFVSWRAV